MGISFAIILDKYPPCSKLIPSIILIIGCVLSLWLFLGICTYNYIQQPEQTYNIKIYTINNIQIVVTPDYNIINLTLQYNRIFTESEIQVDYYHPICYGIDFMRHSNYYINLDK